MENSNNNTHNTWLFTFFTNNFTNNEELDLESPITVLITEKTYWLENNCQCQYPPPFNILKEFKYLDLDEAMENFYEYSGNLTQDQLKQKLIQAGLEENSDFTKYVKEHISV